MTDAELDRLQLLADAATEGPWVWYAEDASMVTLCTDGKEMESVVCWCTRCDSCVKWGVTHPVNQCGWPNKADSDFIREARTAIPELIAEIRRLRNANQ